MSSLHMDRHRQHCCVCDLPAIFTESPQWEEPTVGSSNPTIHSFAALVHLVWSFHLVHLVPAIPGPHKCTTFPNTHRNVHRNSCIFYFPAQCRKDSASLKCLTSEMCLIPAPFDEQQFDPSS